MSVSPERPHRPESLGSEPVRRTPAFALARVNFDSHADPLASPFGAIIAGGASRRFGSPKALANVGRRTIVQRVRAALLDADLSPILIANEPEIFRGLGLPCRPDVRPGAGPLAGIHAALRWAAEAGRIGAVCVAVDMPFLDPTLLRHLALRLEAGGCEAVAPESDGPLGVEPLCAGYSVRCLPIIEAHIARGEFALGRLLRTLDTHRIPLREVRARGEPGVLFFNVNTAEQLELARRIESTPP